MSEALRSDIAYLSGVRKARERQAVLKMKFIDLRGRSPLSPIFVFEGDDDKIVYGRWVNRLRPQVKYEAFVCSGKKKVRSLQKVLVNDLGSLGENVYFFIDKDFDEDRGFIVNDTLFMTDRYSVESYLVNREVLDSLLRDELTCHEHPNIRGAIIAMFEERYEEFLDLTEEFNRKVFIARKKDIVLDKSLPDKTVSYASVGLFKVAPAEISPENLIDYDETLISDEEREVLCGLFSDLDRRHHFRGKNAMMFFTTWLAALCDELSKREKSVFGGPPGNSRLRRDEISLGAFASKSVMPLDLPAFLNQVAA